ncbi:MAG: ABC-2 family transporter protein [Clostridiales Family XIII bacterium]|jgi:ABC-2 type transport system permease protein|nr:ABC-2 family transporter protein [Clostridiales Family XIII bacterium]
MGLSFRVDFFSGILFQITRLILQVMVWKGLYIGRTEVMGIALSDMLTYTVLSLMMSLLVGDYDLMFWINDDVQDGSIVERLTVPIGFGRYYIWRTLAAKPATFLTQILPVVLPAALLFGVRISVDPLDILAAFVAGVLAFAIMTGYGFIMGLTVLWLKNSYFLVVVTALIWQLFSGALVPMWFFPNWLETAGRFLPFRYVVFEPISILMGKTPPEQIPAELCFAAAWAAGLCALALLLWLRGRRRLFVNGG